MRRPHVVLTSTLKNLLLICACLLLSGTHAVAFAQQAFRLTSENTARGIELYKQGNAKEAIKALKKAVKQNKSDADAWQYLGMSYKQQGKTKDAAKALEQAIILRLQSPTMGLFPANKIIAEMTEEERVAYRQQLPLLHSETVEAIENYLQLKPDAGFWRTQAETFKFHLQALKAHANESLIFSSLEVSPKAVIYSKPEPAFTEEARQKGTGGEVLLRLVLAADGTVRYILVLKFLPDGLTEKAIEAARQIRFKPAIKDGRPVSQYVTLAYNFNIY